MSKGKVLAAAMTKGLDSLTKVAQALIDVHPDLFEGIAVRSLGAKLSELNRENVTWWRGRADRLQALKDLLGLEPSELIASQQARQLGLWVCDEFPELPALNLISEQPPTLAEPVAITANQGYGADLGDWLLVALGSDYEQREMGRLTRGVQWLHAPKGTGRSLLLSRIKARNRLAVVEGETLAEVVAHATRSRPVVLAPKHATARSELVALAELGFEQPVLVISAHPLPLAEKHATSRPSLPSWEWLSATRSERVRSVFAADLPDMSGGIFDRDPVVGFKLQLVPNWRSHLLQWVEQRFSKHTDTLFTAQGMSNWLDAFDPDSVLFPTPSAVLSLVRICHEVGERRLPKPSNPDAGMQLVKQLGRADSRYRSLLARLVNHCWLDTGASWQKAKPWGDWLRLHDSTHAHRDDRSSGHHARSAALKTAETETGLLTEIDLDAAVKANLLIPNSDGNYGFMSYAEAALVLRDQLRDWMQAGELSKWGGPIVADPERQQLVDHVLTTVDDQLLLEMCRLASTMPTWSAEALGASEALFLAVGLRMAEGMLPYRTEHGALLTQVLARCLIDEAYIELPLSRSAHTDTDRIDWTRSTWGWSLVAPKPDWVPVCMSDRFPGWAVDDVDWLGHLPTPDDDSSLSVAHNRRLTAAVDTATVVADRVGFPSTNEPEVLLAIVGLLRAARDKECVQSRWWQGIAVKKWAMELLEFQLAKIGPDAHRVLSTSLLEACSTKGEKDSYIVLVSLLHSRLWREILDANNPAELCDTLTPNAMAFVVRNILTFPPALRRAVADKINPAHLPDDFDWHALFSVTPPPSKERLDQLLSGWRYYQIFPALWKLHPEHCLQSAMDPQNPHSESFLEHCTPEWLGELAAKLTLMPDLRTNGDYHLQWAMSRIAIAGPHAPALLELMSVLGVNENPITSTRKKRLFL